jgi:hypothetical protein
VCLLRGTDWIFNIQQFYVQPTRVFMCFCMGLRQTAIISLHSINWLVFITEMECVYCAARTESLAFNSSMFCPHVYFCVFVWAHTCIYVFLYGPTRVFMCFCMGLKQTTIISLHNINWLVFITEMECVYCAVRTESLAFNSSTFCPHSVFMFFLCLSKKTAIISLKNLTGF